MIVLNRMFVGDYCLTNIGHEIINIFQADNGHFYVYLNATGDFAADKQGRIQYVILTRNCSKAKTVQVIGKAKVVNELYVPGLNFDQKQTHGIAEISYGGASIVDLFASNTKDQDVYVTYEVDAITEPASELYISFEESLNESILDANTIYLNINSNSILQMARASLKQYVSLQDEPFAYHQLAAALNNQANWKKDPVQKLSRDEEGAFGSDNFFKMCGIQNSELAFSNAFAYIAQKYRKQFCQFAKEVLHVEVAENFKIFREKWNIDILVADTKHVIVLENKVLSHINGTWFGRKINEEASQLKKYYEIIKCEESVFNTEKEYQNHEAHFYIVVPNHNNIDLNKYERGNLYSTIYYSQILQFFQENPVDDLLIEQLKLALEPHCQKSFDYFYEMKKNFLAKCKEVKNKIHTDDAENP